MQCIDTPKKLRNTKFALILAMIFIVFVSFGYPEKLAVFNELTKPEQFRVDNNRIYITEGAVIYVYSLKDFKLVKKFGKLGEGPREFKVNPPNTQLGLEIFPDRLLVHSMSKISFFTPDGEFVKEQVIGHSNLRKSIGDGYVGIGFAMQNKKLFMVVSLYDAAFKTPREICRVENVFQQAGDIDLMKKPLRFEVGGDKIYVSGKKDFIIDIYDKNGKSVGTIKRDYPLVNVTDNDRKIILAEVKREMKQMWDVLKARIKLGDHYPAIQTIIFRDDKLYAPTFKQKEGKFEVFIFDKDGKFLETVYLPLAKKSALQPYPYDFYKGTLYQVAENEEEDWELRTVKLK